MTIARSSPSGQSAAKLLRSTNLSVDSNGKLVPVARPQRFFDWDYFISGSTIAGGTIGKLGWFLLGSGTPAYARVDGSLSAGAHATLSTSNVATNRATLCLGDIENRTVINPVQVSTLQAIWTMNGSLATKRAFFGFSNNFSFDPVGTAVNALGIAYDASLSPNYLLVNHITTGSGFVDTGIAVPVNTPQLLTLASDPILPSFYYFYLGSASQQSILIGSSALPNPAGYNANLGFTLTTQAGLVSSIGLGYWGINTNVESVVFPQDVYANA